jgi:hydrogenase maturation protease
MRHIVQNSKICIVGIGNTLRSDDGIGALVCSSLEKMDLPFVTTLLVQQLQVELIEDFLSYDYVILADASLTGKEVEFYALPPGQTEAVSSSHQASAKMLDALSQKLYNKRLPLLICAVRGENFEIGDTLSAFAIANTYKAVHLLCNWIKGHTNYPVELS